MTIDECKEELKTAVGYRRKDLIRHLLKVAKNDREVRSYLKQLKVEQRRKND